MDEGLKNLIVKAEHGDVEAMVMVGDCYNRGFHTDKDDSKAQTYYKMAADNGHPAAMFMVGLGYLNGTGVKQNKVTAIKYIQDAANKGVANAQYMMGHYITPVKRELFSKIKRQSSIIKWLLSRVMRMHNMNLGEFICLNGAMVILVVLMMGCSGCCVHHYIQAKNH